MININDASRFYRFFSSYRKNVRMIAWMLRFVYNCRYPDILREKYWVIGGRKVIRTIVNDCVICKRYTAKCAEEKAPPLPTNCVKDAVCFEVVGVDLAGPLYLRDGGKTWICLFTCAIYRAVHLELVDSLLTATFIRALRRFIARRGRKNVIYSDNGTNFVGTENLFSKLNWVEVSNFGTAQKIKWCFNPPSAPWWGGWWERLIGLLKQLLKKVLGKAKLTQDELYTVLCDCESVVNSRPLTFLSEQTEDLITLSPVVFLRDLRESGVPDLDTVDRNALNRRYRYLQKLSDDLRKRFRSECLGQLQQTRFVKNPRNVSLNEVVLIGNDNSKRLDWIMGRVIELIPGIDGKVRLVKLHTPYG
ncbi:uncharacterized protein [Onthophagus taurus]|uniref:uncharacterized protein n=1 Tax=Onthophagus taurus TaxID=166361 RepID=UPI0039BE5CCB